MGVGSKVIMDYKCVVCDFDIKEIEPSLKTDKPEQGMYSSGVVDKISAGYGSLLDGNIHIIAICDKCLNEKTLKGITPFIGDYMCPERDEYFPLRGQPEDKKSFMAYVAYALVVAFQYILSVSVCVIMRILVNTFLNPYADYEMAIGWAGGTFFVLIMSFHSSKWTNWVCKFLKIK